MDKEKLEKAYELLSKSAARFRCFIGDYCRYRYDKPPCDECIRKEFMKRANKPKTDEVDWV